MLIVVLLAHLFVYHLQVLGPRSQKSSPRSWIPLELALDGCGLPLGCCELNLGPLKEQAVLLTSEDTLLKLCMVQCLLNIQTAAVLRLLLKLYS